MIWLIKIQWTTFRIRQFITYTESNQKSKPKVFVRVSYSGLCPHSQKKKVKCYSLSPVWLFLTQWTTACQAPLSMGFSRQEYWSGLPFPSPGDLPDPEIEFKSPVLQADSSPSETPGKPHTWKRMTSKQKGPDEGNPGCEIHCCWRAHSSRQLLSFLCCISVLRRL